MPACGVIPLAMAKAMASGSATNPDGDTGREIGGEDAGRVVLKAENGLGKELLPAGI